MIGAMSGLDWSIVVGYLLVSLWIGVLANRRVAGSLTGYLVAGRKLGTALSVATLTGSELGLITVMYMAQKGYAGGLAALHIALAAGVAAALVGVTGFLIVPLRRFAVMTIPEFYELRFGRRVRVLGGVLLALGGILNMGLFLKVGAVFVAGVSGLAADGAAVGWIMAALLLLVLFYTVLGGMVSVVLTDYVQFVVLSVGLIVLVLLALQQHDFDTVARVVSERKGQAGLDPTVAGGEFGTAYIGWQLVLGVVSCAVWPTAVARALSARNEQVVKRQFMLASVSFLIRFLIPCFLGTCAFVYFSERGVQYTDAATLSALPHYLAELLPVGLLGVVVAAMLAAFMSTHDSYLLAWASVLSRDVVAPLRGKLDDEVLQMRWTRIFIVGIGAWVLGWGLLYQPKNEDLWDYLGVAGAIYFTGAIVVLTAGLYWPRASSTGAVLALVAGFGAVLGLGQVRTLLAIPLDAAEIGLAVLAAAVLAMIAGSLLFPDRQGVGRPCR